MIKQDDDATVFVEGGGRRVLKTQIWPPNSKISHSTKTVQQNRSCNSSKAPVPNPSVKASVKATVANIKRAVPNPAPTWLENFQNFQNVIQKSTHPAK
jgi:hypothetical protein